MDLTRTANLADAADINFNVSSVVSPHMLAVSTV